MPPTPTKLLLAALCGSYVLSYGVVRLTSLGAIEAYPQGKGGPRQDFITKRNHVPGEGWEYAVFWPAIKLEETALSFSRRNRPEPLLCLLLAGRKTRQETSSK